MTLVDWIVVVLFLAATLIVGLWFAKRASRSMTDYFVAGRTLPWWLAGTSMLSTSFASDTPLHVTRNIRENGLAAGWFYWNGIIGGLIVAFVFSKLWRRAGVVTDNELVELRYAGKPAAVLRGLMAMLKAFVLEILTMAWITLGMTKIVKSIAGLPDTVSIFGATLPSEVVVVVVLLSLCLAFSVVSGFWGVVTTDILEFSVAMLGAIVLSVMALDKVGGVDGLKAGLASSHLGDRALSYTPDLEGQGLTIFAFSVYLGVQWWANNQVDGTGQRAQRFLACKDDQNAMAAGIWNMAVQYIIRSWPWYVAALASVILYPDLVDHESAYPKMVADILPIGIKGLMVASFFAAFMGTIEAHYNLTASYATNDVYKRFVKKDGDAHHYVKASRVITVVIAALAGVVALLLDSVLGAFRFKMELVAGIGLVYVLRWLWWRVNATTEIVALLTSALTAITLQYVPGLDGKTAHDSAVRLVLVVIVSALCAFVAALLTKPEPTEHLVAFFRRVRPPRALWKPIADRAGVVDDDVFSWRTPVQIGIAIVFVFTAMIGLGELILGSFALGVVLAVVAVVSGWWTLRQVLRA